MKSHTVRPFDADEADVVEQHQPIVDDDEHVALPEELPLADADPADALDQYRTVPIDDDWPNEPNA